MCADALHERERLIKRKAKLWVKGREISAPTVENFLRCRGGRAYRVIAFAKTGRPQFLSYQNIS